MTLPDVVAFLDLCDDIGVAPWLSGGWGVDALLGEQTRRHADLDIFLEARHSAVLVQHLAARGFAPVPRDDTCAWNFVHADAHAREIDVHLIELSASGDASYGPDEVFPPDLLTGHGTVGGRRVRCLSPQWEVRFHTGYPVDDDDWHDVSALCARFGLPIPHDYSGFVGGDL